jgi:ubiquinone/menaquinone biosynthesis C-methylase UbiE
MKQAIISQFGHPTGLLGHLVGRIMASSNRERIEWAVGLLDLRPSDKVLEVGFGPGLAIEMAAKTAVISGIDPSDVMLKQASQRNREGIWNGRVYLQQGSVTQLPYEDDTFHKAFTINSLHHWPDALAGLHEMHRVLKANGRITLIEQPRWAKSEADIQQRSHQLQELLTQTGFHTLTHTFKPLNPVTGIALLGVK